MRPILFDSGIELPLLGRLDVPAYFTLLTLSFAIGMWMTWREAPKVGLDRERVLDLNLWIVVWGIVGARVLHVIADGHLMDYVHLCTDPTLVAATDARVAVCNASQECGWSYVCDLATHACHPPRDCLAAIKVWRGGLAYYGGFIFAAAFALRYARQHQLAMWRVADLISPWIAFGLAVTRIGCFFNGCCYGKRTDGPWGVRFPPGSVVHEFQARDHLVGPQDWALPVHPTELYLAALNLLVFALLYFVVRARKRFDGQVFAWLLIGKGVARSLVEIVRDDERGVLWGWLSTSQMLSVPLITLGIVILVRGGRLWSSEPQPPPAVA